MTRRYVPYRNEKGLLMPTGLVFLAMLCLLGATGATLTSTDLKIGTDHRAQLRTVYAAESGLQSALVEVRQNFRSLTPSMSITPPSISGIVFDTFTVAQVGSSSSGQLTDGPFVGLHASTQDYKITSEARLDNTTSSSELVLTVKDELIPLFQFGVFYENTLEMLPGPDMYFTGGRIHSNGDIYFNAGTNGTLTIDSLITGAGDMYRGRKDKVEVSGAVDIMDGEGNYQEMTFDSTDSDWKNKAETLWQGTFQSGDHGIYDLFLPTAAGDPRDILETGAGSLYQKSGLRIIDGVARDKNGNVVDLTDGGSNPNPILTDTFYDWREQATITVWELDIDKLQDSSNGMAALGNPPSGGDAGILYVSSSDSSRSIRLTNGSILPATGLSVVSNNPVYIQGNYNSQATRPAAVIADAVNVLSNNWSDANSYNSDTAARVATDTVVNAAFMAGNKETTVGQYSGGLENFPRFLEKWSGVEFSWSGSMVCLWESQQATGNWKYGNPIYHAPVRDWAYGMDIADMPPGTPKVRNIEKFGWFRTMD